MKTAVFIGRFQPVHAGHVPVANEALKKYDHLIIVIGSSHRPQTFKNPFTFEDRVDLWKAEIPCDNVTFVPVMDSYYSDYDWVSRVKFRVGEVTRDLGSEDVFLVGYQKDESSYYLSFFPEWKNRLTDDPSYTFSATPIREFFYKAFIKNPNAKSFSQDYFYGDKNLRGLTYNSAIWGAKFQEALRKGAQEWDFANGYDPSAYPIIVTTVDTVVVQNGHVLVITRKHKPHAGQKAIPGGHIDPNETLKAAALRELREETKIDLSDKVLSSYMSESPVVFDHPNRSSRARVITNVFLIKLPDEDKMVKVRGGDDADQAFWMPLNDLSPEDFFEDHYDILKKMTAGL